MQRPELLSKPLKWLATVALNGIFMITGIGSSIIGSTLPSLAFNLDVEINHMTAVVMSKGIGYVLGPLMTPYISSKLKVSQYGLLVFSTLCIAIGQFLAPLMTNIAGLCAMEVITGYGMGVTEIAGYVIIFQLWNGHMSDAIIQSSQLCYALGSALAPFLSLFFIYESDFGCVPVVVGNETEFFNATSSPTNCVNATKKMLFGNIPLLLCPYAIVCAIALLISIVFLYLNCTQTKLLASRKDEGKERDNKKFRYLWLFFMAIFFFCHVGMEISFSSFLYTFLTIGDLQATKTIGTTVNFVWWMSFMFGNIAAMLFSKKLTPKQILSIDAVGMFFGIIFLILTIFVNSKFIWGGITVIGFFIASMYPSGLSWSDRMILFNNKATSTIVVSASLGDVSIQFFIGMKIKDNPNALLWILCGVTLIAIISFLCLVALENNKYKFPSPDEDPETSKSKSIEKEEQEQNSVKTNGNTKSNRDEEIDSVSRKSDETYPMIQSECSIKT